MPSPTKARGLHLGLLVILLSIGLMILLAYLNEHFALPSLLSRGIANLTACPHRMITGRGCPLCGVTRAALVLLSGDPEGSARHHPLPLLAAPLYVAQLIHRAHRILRPRFIYREELGYALVPLAAGFLCYGAAV